MDIIITMNKGGDTLIKTAFCSPENNDMESIKKALPESFKEKNESYINSLLTKKHQPSLGQSLLGLLLLSSLIEDLDIDPSLGRDQYGRPFFINENRIDFNISHSNSLVACALCISESANEKARIGIDCEEIYKKDPTSLAERFFTAEEADIIRNSNDPKYTFTRMWTQKEAYLKYKGTGITEPLNSFKVSSIPLQLETFEKMNNIVTLCYDPNLK